jgi:glyoxylase-like metal-dependent hydrolase (beta-lactamase superfamily II)
LVQSERLRVVEAKESATDILGEGYAFHYSSGHTPGLLLTEVAMPKGPVVFAADLIPGTPWVHLPITMGYDRFPELLIEEKDELLHDLLARQGRLFYTHDSETALSGLSQDERGRFSAKGKLASLHAIEE